MAELEIKMQHKKLVRLKRHLEKEHPSTKGRMKIEGGHDMKKHMIKGYLRKVPGSRKKVLIKRHMSK